MVQFLPATILLIGILAGIWLNRRDYETFRREQAEKFDQLSGDMNRQFGEVNRRLMLIESDQKQFFALSGKLEGRIDELSRR